MPPKAGQPNPAAFTIYRETEDPRIFIEDIYRRAAGSGRPVLVTRTAGRPQRAAPTITPVRNQEFPCTSYN
jgi:hypothetical protein